MRVNPSVRKGGAEERILATAAGLFATFGYKGVSTRDIATGAGVNEVTIYRIIPGSGTCILQCWSQSYSK